jgi:hypothetical protein
LDDFQELLKADYIVYGRVDEPMTPSLVVELEPMLEGLPITVVAVNNKETMGSGLMFVHKKQGTVTNSLYKASLERDTSGETIDIVMRQGVAGLTPFSLDFSWEAFRWGHGGLKHLLESIMTQDECLRYKHD